MIVDNTGSLDSRARAASSHQQPVAGARINATQVRRVSKLSGLKILNKGKQK